MKTELSTPSLDERSIADEEGEGVSDSLAEFSDEDLPQPLRQALQTKGYQTLTSVQRSVVAADTSTRDLRISSQTGSGKTVAVGLALGRQLLQSGPRADEASGKERRAPRILLLTPTRELAAQVKRELSWLLSQIADCPIEVVTGGTSVGMERKNLSRGPRIVVGTPGRVLDHLQNEGFLGHAVEQVVLDEADQMLDMGFRDELKAILDQLPARRRTHLVSATFSGEVLRIADQYQENPLRIEGSALGAANEDIEHVAHVVAFRHRYDALVNLLLKAHALSETGEPGRTLVFTRTRADTLEVAERLQRDGIRAEPLSGELAQAQRTRTLSSFRSGNVSTLVATDVAARGLDIAGVDLVIHLDPPSDPDAFTHRSGRTGRAGRKGTSVLLLPPQARGRVERLLRQARVKPSWAPVPSADKIKKLYSKVKKRRLFAALGDAPPEEDLEYAKKLLQEHDPEQVVAQLLSLHEVKPLCPPREVSEHFPADAAKGHDGRGRRDQNRAPRGRRRFNDQGDRPGFGPRKWDRGSASGGPSRPSTRGKPKGKRYR